MTHGYRLVVDGIARPWRQLLRSGDAMLEAIATDWVFGTTPPVIPPSGGTWWKTQKRRPWWLDDDEDWLMLQ